MSDRPSWSRDDAPWRPWQMDELGRPRDARPDPDSLRREASASRPSSATRNSRRCANRPARRPVARATRKASPPAGRTATRRAWRKAARPASRSFRSRSAKPWSRCAPWR
ncbi:hypothetical protein ACFSHR_01875 [Azotobacter chroococcum]